MDMRPSFEVRVQRSAGRIRVVPRGELDLATAPQLERDVQAVRDGAEDVVLDLSQLTFIDSSGLRALIALDERAKAEGWRLSLVDPAPATQTIFRVSGVDKHLPFVEGDEDG
jgi:anti-sigma B factor antagonist